MKKLRFGAIKQMTQNHTSQEWQYWDLTLDNLRSEASLPTLLLLPHILFSLHLSISDSDMDK